MLLHGLRSCEVLSLNREDVQLPDLQVRVRGKGKRIRVLPLARESVELLDHYMGLERPPAQREAIRLSQRTGPQQPDVWRSALLFRHAGKYRGNAGKPLISHNLRFKNGGAGITCQGVILEGTPYSDDGLR